MSLLAESIGVGLVSATLLMFGAGGFSLQYGLTNLFNFAFGSIMTASAFVAFAVARHGGNFIESLIAAAAFGALFSTGLNAWVYRPYARRGAGLFGIAFVAVAIGTVMQYVLALVFGVDYVSLPLGSSVGHTYHLGSVVFTTLELEFFVFACVFFALLQIALRYTLLGKAIRGTAANPLLARSCRISVTRVVNLTWALSGAMCGIAGFYLVLQLGSFSYTSGQDLFPAVLAAALVGRAGSASGAVKGALLVGVSAEVLAAFTNPAFNEVYAFGMLVLVLIVRRQGLMRGVQEQLVVT